MYTYTYVLRVWGLREKTPGKTSGSQNYAPNPGMYVCVHKNKRLRLTLAPKNPTPTPLTQKTPTLALRNTHTHSHTQIAYSLPHSTACNLGGLTGDSCSPEPRVGEQETPLAGDHKSLQGGHNLWRKRNSLYSSKREQR